jgi:hypothetical protein
MNGDARVKFDDHRASLDSLVFAVKAVAAYLPNNEIGTSEIITAQFK